MAIKNYLKDVKDIIAPLNWKSAPDSPPTQLAYVTKPEIDMLVKANIHGSMKGKPNKGPKGIISLDGFGVDDKDSVVSQAQQQQFNQNLQNLQESGQGNQFQVNTSQSSFDQPGAGSTIINSVDYGQAYEDEQNILGGTNDVVTDNQGNAINLSNPNLQPEGDKDKGTGIKNETVQNFLFGSTGDPSANITDFQQSGKHPLRAQLDYLRFKYGDSFLDTEQAQVLMGYLSGVPVERGGGLGARDQKQMLRIFLHMILLQENIEVRKKDKSLQMQRSIEKIH